MYEIRLNWKETPVSLVNLENHLRQNYSESYVGNSAGAQLVLYFSEEVSEERKENILDYWDFLDGSDYKSAEQIRQEAEELKQAIAQAKSELILKSWDEMTVVERKIALNMEVTRSEMGLE